MTERRALIVEDEATQLHMLKSVVERDGYVVETATDGAQAIKRLRDPLAPVPDVMLLDLMLPVIDGISVLREIRPAFPNLPIVMLTAKSTIQTVVDAMQAGANDFVVKPASAERIRNSLKAAMETADLVGEISVMGSSVDTSTFNDLVGNSAKMQEAKRLAEKAAHASIPVLIEGESGVGKEVFAKAIHAASDRCESPFVAVNCGAIPENLVESILFGHEKGAFTGATEKRIGKFQEANQGTLFLDEVGELPLDVQVKLLRAIQESEIDPVGARQSIKVNIRIISATNRHLIDLVTGGGFREDLFYRLNVFPIHLPPLRERREDIPALTHHFLEMIASREQTSPKAITMDTIRALEAYHWPGNIRQLYNALFRAFILSDTNEITIRDFPHLGSTHSYDNRHKSEGQEVTNQAQSDTAAVSSEPYLDADGHILPLEDIERAAIQVALKRYDNRMSEIARRLKIGRSTLYRKIAEFGLQDDL